MQPMTLSELMAAVGGTPVGPAFDPEQTVCAVDIDSRKIRPGALYLPMVGERFDGHSFIPEALEAGAAGCLLARERDVYREEKFYIKVRNTRKALRDLSKYYKKKFDIPFIGITGSVGKTTTKEMVAAVLSERFRVHKTDGNYNNDVGLPLTLLGLEPGDEICVLEMGTNHFGEIAYLGAIAEPDVAVLTNIGDCHIEFLGDRAGVLKAKSEIFDFLPPDGLAVLNGDDALLAPLKDTLSMPVVLCGTGEGQDYTARDIRQEGSRLTCTVETPRGSFPVTVPAPGAHMAYAVLLAAAVAQRYGMSGAEIARGVLRFAPGRMRMNVLDRPGGVRILDDAYNANPQSMRAAIEVLVSGVEGRRVAVLGDMFELGSFAEPLHAEVGEYLGRAGVDCLVAIGGLARHIYDAAGRAGVAERHWFETVDDADEALKSLVRPDTTILVKGSRGMALERVVARLTALTERDD